MSLSKLFGKEGAIVSFIIKQDDTFSRKKVRDITSACRDAVDRLIHRMIRLKMVEEIQTGTKTRLGSQYPIYVYKTNHDSVIVQFFNLIDAKIERNKDVSSESNET